MELKEKITLDMLTKDSVSVLRQQFLTFNGEEMQVGGNIRNAYMNDESGREQLRKVLSDEYFNAVLAVWQWMIQIESWKLKIAVGGVPPQSIREGSRIKKLHQIPE